MKSRGWAGLEILWSAGKKFPRDAMDFCRQQLQWHSGCCIHQPQSCGSAVAPCAQVQPAARLGSLFWTCTTECAQTTGQHRWKVGTYLHLHGCIGLVQTWTVWAAQCCSSPAAAQDWSLLFIQTPVADLSHTISPVAGLRSLVFQLFASAHLNALSFADLYTCMQSQEFPENCPSSVGVEAMEFLFH